MCLCKGTGGITQRESWGYKVVPCPDSSCCFDRKAADDRYQAWWQKVEAYLETGADMRVGGP